jgi:hypothetical protein
MVFRKRWFGKIDMLLRVGNKQYIYRARASKQDLAGWQHWQWQYPQGVTVRELQRTYWNFQGRWFWDNDGLNPQQVHALLVTRMQRQQATLDRAQAMVAMGTEPRQSARGDIPDDLKQYVFMRDQGRCRSCGATTELQFDHIIPVALGGATSAENLQVLCGPCNRRKGAGLTVR